MDEELADETIRQMIQLVNPEWDIRQATPAESGFCAVYRVIVETPTSSRDCFLKASPDGDHWGISADARIMAVLQKHTSIPVPEVIGVVDDHMEVPSPFYLMDSMVGSDIAYEEVGWVSDTVLQTTARQVGAYLGELHQVGPIDSFGYVNFDTSQQLKGGRPSGTVAELDVTDGSDSWQAYLREYVERELERHATTQFAGLTPKLDSWCHEQIESLTGAVSPVLGRNDHGYHNLLINPDTGEVTAMLDWAYTLAVTPAFDFQFGSYLFSGAFLSAIPDVPNRQALVRDAMLAGYRSTASERYDAVSTYHPLYELLATIRIMNDFDKMSPKLPEESEDAVANGLRNDIESLLEKGAQ